MCKGIFKSRSKDLRFMNEIIEHDILNQFHCSNKRRPEMEIPIKRD